jgi:hypothetical protein
MSLAETRVDFGYQPMQTLIFRFGGLHRALGGLHGSR